MRCDMEKANKVAEEVSKAVLTVGMLDGPTPAEVFVGVATVAVQVMSALEKAGMVGDVMAAIDDQASVLEMFEEAEKAMRGSD